MNSQVLALLSEPPRPSPGHLCPTLHATRKGRRTWAGGGHSAEEPSQHSCPAAGPTWNSRLLLGLGIFSSHLWVNLERQQGGNSHQRPLQLPMLRYKGETEAQGEGEICP